MKVHSMLIILSFCAGIYFCYTKYEELDSKGADSDIEWKFTSGLDGFKNSKKFWLAAGEPLDSFIETLIDKDFFYKDLSQFQV